MRKFCVKQNLIKYKEKICLYPHHSELVEDSDRNPSCAWCGYRLDFSAALADAHFGRNDGKKTGHAFVSLLEMMCV